MGEVIVGLDEPTEAATLPLRRRRPADPARAVAGATHLVVGRSITRAKSPRAVYQQVLEVIT